MNNINVLIIGSDINAYYMARNFNEAFNIKPHLIAKIYLGLFGLSNILTYEIEPNINKKDIFLKKLKEYGKTQKNKTILIPCNDLYTRLIVENKKELNKYYIFNVCSEELVNNFLRKDLFYEKYKNVLNLPKTYIYNCSKKNNLKELKNFMYPLVIKPGDGVDYYKHEFDGQAKVFKIENESELKTIINKIEESGYKKELIIQEFIPGGDECLFDVLCYCSKKKKVEYMTFAQIGLQEHTKEGVGNLTMLVNGFNEFGNTNEIISVLKSFLENVGYQGFCEFDLKYDKRDKKFKVFEINPRQSRSGYYMSACGYNMANILVDDIILNKKKNFTFIDKEYVLTFVPKYVIKKHVQSEALRDKAIELINKGEVANPLKNKKEKNIKRKIWLVLRDYNYIKKYKNNDWWKNNIE